MSVTVSHAPKNPPVPRAFLVSAKNAVLGEAYELSVAYVGPKRMQALNGTFRDKNKPTDILSFPLSAESGEIIFCVSEVNRQAPLFNRTPKNFIKFLFIHGLLHLKGFAHGSRMEKQERKFRKRFNV